MTYEQRNMSGSLFSIPPDKQRDNGPKYDGTAKIDGVEYRISGWIKTSANGMKWMSLSFKLKEDQKRNQDEDDIPF